MIKDFAEGINAYLEALAFTGKHRLWKYYFIPGLIALLVAIIFLVLGWNWGNQVGRWLAGIYPFEFGQAFVTEASGWVGRAFFIIFGILTFKYLILIASAPVMSLLSERVEKLELSGEVKELPLSLKRIILEFIRGIKISVRNIARELIYVILLSIIGILGPVGILSSVLILLVQSYYAGFGSMDFTLERHMNVRESVVFVRQNKGLAIANGMIFLFLLSTVVGALVAPALSTIAAALPILRKL